MVCRLHCGRTYVSLPGVDLLRDRDEARVEQVRCPLGIAAHNLLAPCPLARIREHALEHEKAEPVLNQREREAADEARRVHLLAAGLVPAEDVRLVGLVVVCVDPVERADLVACQTSRFVLARSAGEDLWAEASEKDLSWPALSK